MSKLINTSINNKHGLINIINFKTALANATEFIFKFILNLKLDFLSICLMHK